MFRISLRENILLMAANAAWSLTPQAPLVRFLYDRRG